MRLRVNVQRVVRTRLHTRFASNAAPVIEIDDPVSTRVQRGYRTNFNTRRVVALVAAHDREQPTRIWKLAFLDVLNPGPIYSDRHIMFRFAGHRARMASDAAAVVDNESEVSQFVVRRVNFL